MTDRPPDGSLTSDHTTRQTEPSLWQRLSARIFRWQTLIWLIAVALVGWSLSQVQWQEMLNLLASLTLRELAVLVLLNVALTLCLSARDWVLLHASGQGVPLRSTISYYLAGFAFSFFTPGPQLHGAPLQVYLLQRDYPINVSAATAAITVSKLLEGVANIVFLSVSLYAILQLGFFPRAAAPSIGLMVAFLLLMVGSYGFLTWRGRQPLSWLLARLPARWRIRQPQFLNVLADSELQIGSYFRRHPLALTVGLMLSFLATLLILLQFYVMLLYLGITLPLLEVISLMVTVQISVLFPTPAGLGAMEAALLFVFQRLGYSAGQGAAFALLLRIRDLGFGLAGLFTGGWSFVRGAEQIETPSAEGDGPEH